MKKTFQVSAQVMGVVPKVDGSLSLRFITQEMTNDEKVLVMNYMGSQGWLLFQENQFKEEDVPAGDAPTDELKSPSQRLRAVMFLLWSRRADKTDFEAYYRQHMEIIIDQLKEKLSLPVDK